MAIGREAFGRGAQMLWAQRRAGRLRRLQHSRLAALVATTVLLAACTAAPTSAPLATQPATRSEV